LDHDPENAGQLAVLTVWAFGVLRRGKEMASMVDKLTNPTVKAAITALQEGDPEAWSALFEREAALFDDGRSRSLEEFTRSATRGLHRSTPSRTTD
jgi:hypothetical protein